MFQMQRVGAHNQGLRDPKPYYAFVLKEKYKSGSGDSPSFNTALTRRSGRVKKGESIRTRVEGGSTPQSSKDHDTVIEGLLLLQLFGIVHNFLKIRGG